MPAEPSHIAFRQQPSNASVVMEPELLDWLRGAQLQLFPAGKRFTAESAEVQCRRHRGAAISVLQLTGVGLDRLLFRNHADRLSLVFAEFGQGRGSAGGRPYSFMPQRFSFMLLPADVLQLLNAAPRLGALVVELPMELLLKECALHEISNPDLITLQDTIPGHEVLLIACARQLLEASSLPEGMQRERLARPLELSILSLVASLVASRPLREISAAPAQAQDQHVQNALLYFEEHISSSIALIDICKACNVSARTLQASFQVVMQRTPLQALLELRLNRLRQLLLKGMEVRLACQQSGLPPSGRMAAYYKNLFGELPSQTRLNAAS